MDKKSYVTKGISDWNEAAANVVSEINKYRPEFPDEVISNLKEHIKTYYSMYPQEAGDKLENFVDDYIGMLAKNDDVNAANLFAKDFKALADEFEDFEWPLVAQSRLHSKSYKEHTLRWPDKDKELEKVLSEDEKKEKIDKMVEEEVVFESLDSFLEELKRSKDIEHALIGMVAKGIITMNHFEEMKSGIAGKSFDDAKGWLATYVNSHEDIVSNLSNLGFVRTDLDKKESSFNIDSKKIDKAAEYDKTGGIWEVNSGEKTIQRKKMIDNAIAHSAALQFGVGDKILYATLDSFDAGIVKDINDNGKYVVENEHGEKEIVEPENVFSTVSDEIF